MEADALGFIEIQVKILAAMFSKKTFKLKLRN